ncbi:MAG: type II toxin-antitoxin system VapC family toxin [Chloroflexota bacterium]
MSAYTVDASVHINALNAREQGSRESQAFLARVEDERLEVICPTLLVAEAAAALSRALGDPEQGLAFACAIRDLPNLALVPLDEPLADLAAELAARHRLRGADAVYAAVAQRHGALLVTNDRQQLERLEGILPVARPGQALAGSE